MTIEIVDIPIKHGDLNHSAVWSSVVSTKIRACKITGLILVPLKKSVVLPQSFYSWVGKKKNTHCVAKSIDL